LTTNFWRDPPGIHTRIAATVFAVTMLGLGIGGLASHDFAAIWQPVPKRWPAREALVWFTGLVALACGFGLAWRRTAALAGAVLTAVLLAWMLVFKATVIFRAPGVAAAWESCGETAVIAAGAWVLFAMSGGGWRPLRVVVGESGLHLARSLYGLAMLAFGAAHLAYVKETAALVPSWLPVHVAWVYSTGAAYIAAGLAMLAGVWARLAATLSATQIAVFTLLVWAPAVATPGASADDWSEAVISWTLTAAAGVVAASYGDDWLAVRGRRRAVR
jgi:uncharacterized membrane protein